MADEKDPFKNYDITQRATIAKMLITYDLQVDRVKRAYKTLGNAEKKLEAVFGKEYSDFSVFPDTAWHSQDLQTILKKLKCNAWRAIINRLQIRKFMSVKAWEALDKKLEDPKQMPALTMQHVADVVATYEQKAMEFLEEAIREVYDDLRPHDGYHGSSYKTNQKNAKYEIGPNIILTSTVHTEYGGQFIVNSRDEQKLISLDRVFSHLDGFNIQGGLKSPLVDAINTSPGIAETDFFKVKCYLNGNLHLWFKRLDLLKKFNAVAGGAHIMPNVK
jgi:hypothetical protein